MDWLNGELLILYNSDYEVHLGGMVHLLGGGGHIMFLDIFDVFCKYGFEGLMCEIN